MRPDIARIAAYAVAYLLATSVTIHWTRYSGGLALFWPGTAIAAVLFLRFTYRDWPAAAAVFVLASTIATAAFGFGPVAALPLAFVNIGEAMLTALFLRRARPQGDFIDSGSGILALIAVAGAAVPAMMALPGGSIAWLAVAGSWSGHVLSWIVGHGLGALLIMPLALLITAKRGGSHGSEGRLRRARFRYGEFLALMGVVGIVSAATIFQTEYPLLFLPIVPIVLASYRFGRFGGAVAVLVVTVAAAASLALDTGHFAALDMETGAKVLFLQFYLAVLLMIALPLAVALSQRERLLAEIVGREEMQRVIADHSDDALLHLDQNGLIRFASPASQGLSGLSDLNGQPIACFFGKFDGAVVEEALADARRFPGSTRIVERSVTRGHATMWLEAKIRAVYSTGATRSFVVTIRDVTARKLDELQNAREARTDALTGLPNRRAFLDLIEHRLDDAARHPFALALVDLDHFKRVNDTYGHDIGDAVLKKVAALMREHASRDCFFARLGGEEFGIVAMRDAASRAPAICEELRRAIEAYPMVDQNGGVFSITASLGVARVCERHTPSMAMNAADAPLYAAKAAGRNTVRIAADEGSNQIHLRRRTDRPSDMREVG